MIPFFLPIMYEYMIAAAYIALTINTTCEVKIDYIPAIQYNRTLFFTSMWKEIPIKKIAVVCVWCFSQAESNLRGDKK